MGTKLAKGKRKSDALSASSTFRAPCTRTLAGVAGAGVKIAVTSKFLPCWSQGQEAPRVRVSRAPLLPCTREGMDV